MEHTIRRGAMYHFRRRIPLDLVAAYGGRREVTYSLKTKDKTEAGRAARRASVALDDEWGRMRNERAEPVRTGETQHQIEQAEYEHELGAEEDRQAEAEADRVLAALRIKGVQMVPAQAPTRAKKRTTLDELVEHWKRERKPNAKTVAKMSLAVLEFDLLHKDTPVESITRPMVIAYRTHLLGTGKAKGTIDDRLSSIGTLLSLAVDHGVVETNVGAKAALPPEKRPTKARIGYSTAQAAKVMQATESYRDTEPAKFWLPRLARWTGARLNELHQLRREDLTERQGHRGILVTDEGDHAEGIDMRTKNAASRRWVPLHAEVGEFWTWAMTRPAGALFPAKPDKYGIVSTAFSKWYGRQLRGAWGIADERVTYHGWRHGFADACRAAGVQDSVRYALMGHAEGGAAGGYGSGELPPKVLAEAIGKLGASPKD